MCENEFFVASVTIVTFRKIKCKKLNNLKTFRLKRIKYNNLNKRS